jgi:hypothetical protein
VRFAADERLDSAPRFLSGSLISALHAVWSCFAALGSLIAVLILERSALAIDAMLNGC